MSVTSHRITARKVVAGRGPTADGAALGKAMLPYARKGIHIEVNLDGLRRGAVSSTFINTALDILCSEITSFDPVHDITWQSDNRALLDVANYCSDHFRDARPQ